MSKSAPARSWEWVNHVRDNCRMASSARHLLMAIATYADASGHAHPSQRELADATGYDERHIRRLLTALEEAGWVVTSDGRGRGKRTDFTLVAEPVKADPQSRNTEDEKRTPEPGIEQAKEDSQSRLSDAKSGHLEQQKRTSGTLKADICASEYKEVEPAIEPAIEPECAQATQLTAGQHANAIFHSLCDGLKHKPGKVAGRAMDELTSLVATHGHEAVAAAFDASHLLAVRSERRNKFPMETFAGLWSNAEAVYEILTNAMAQAAPQTQEDNAWATLPRPGAISKPSSADKTTVAP